MLRYCGSWVEETGQCLRIGEWHIPLSEEMWAEYERVCLRTWVMSRPWLMLTRELTRQQFEQQYPSNPSVQSVPNADYLYWRTED